VGRGDHAFPTRLKTPPAPASEIIRVIVGQTFSSKKNIKGEANGVNPYRLNVTTPLRLANKLYQNGFAVICSQALNSVCARRFCACLARNRLNIVASSPLAARRVLLADSAIGMGQPAVIAKPSRTRPAHNATGSIASIP
jgi:hypothetical protein